MISLFLRASVDTNIFFIKFVSLYLNKRCYCVLLHFQYVLVKSILMRPYVDKEKVTKEK